MSSRSGNIPKRVGLVVALIGLIAILPTHRGPPVLAGSRPSRSNQGAPSTRTSPGGGKILTCGVSGSDMFQVQKEGKETLRTCSLTVPESGQLFVAANASAGYQDGYARVFFRVEIDGRQRRETDRYLAVYNDAGDGSDASVALSGLFPVEAGRHSVTFVGQHKSGTGTMRVYDPTLTVIYIPGSGTDLRTCSDMDDTLFTATSPDYQVMRSCSLQALGDGWAFVSADASVWSAATPYEAAFDVGIDNTTGTSDTTRWVDSYSVGQKAAERTAALTMLRPVSGGSRTFNFVTRRTAGTGEVRVGSPALSVIYWPAASPHVTSCSVVDREPWSTKSVDFSVIRQCSLDLDQESVALVSADANLGIEDSPFEVHLRLGIDSTVGSDDVDRYSNVYANGGDGTDDTAAVSVLKPVSAGSHTFYFLARRMVGPGTTHLRYPTLSVLALPATAQHRIYMPVLLR